MAHLRHPFQFLPEEVDAEFAQLLVVEAHPARSGAHGFHILGLHLAAIETDGAVSGSHFVHHAPGIVMGIGLGSEFWGVFLHEILSLGVQEPGSLGKKARLPFPREIDRHVPHLPEFEIPHGATRVPGDADAFAGWRVLMVGGLPAARIGGEQDGAGLDEDGHPALAVEAHGPGHAFAVGDDVGDDRAPKPPHAPLFAFLLEQAGFFDAAHPVGVVVIIAHVIKGSLGDEAQFALIVADEFVPQILKIHEPVIGLCQNLPEKLLVGEAVVIIHEIVEQIVQLHIRLLDDHVPAGKPAQPAPVSGALVHDQHVAQKVPGAHGSPHPAETAADNQQVRRILIALFFHMRLAYRLSASI